MRCMCVYVVCMCLASFVHARLCRQANDLEEAVAHTQSTHTGAYTQAHTMYIKLHAHVRREAAELEEAGADHTVINATAAGLSMGSGILERMGGSVGELDAMQRSIEQAMVLKYVWSC